MDTTPIRISKETMALIEKSMKHLEIDYKTNAIRVLVKAGAKAKGVKF